MVSKAVRAMSNEELIQRWRDHVLFIGEHTNYIDEHRMRFREVERWLGALPPHFNLTLSNRNMQAWGWLRSLWWPTGVMQSGVSWTHYTETYAAIDRMRNALRRGTSLEEAASDEEEANNADPDWGRAFD